MQFTASDLALTTLTGWSAQSRRRRPPPGAILLRASDISNASALNKHAVARAMSTPSPSTRPWALRKALAKRRTTVFRVSPKQRRHALQAERLDMQASLPPGFPGSSVWDMLAQCEANGDWAADNGDGFYGGLQSCSSTWDENGGGGYAPVANQATRESTAIAKSVLARYGWVAWPVCSQKLGLANGNPVTGRLQMARTALPYFSRVDIPGTAREHGLRLVRFLWCGGTTGPCGRKSRPRSRGWSRRLAQRNRRHASAMEAMKLVSTSSSRSRGDGAGGGGRGSVPDPRTFRALPYAPHTGAAS